MIQARPYFTAAGAGAALQSAYMLGVSALFYLFLEPAAANIQLPNLNPDLVVGISSIGGLFAFCLAPFFHAGVGFLYSQMVWRETPAPAADLALGGAVAAGTARLVAGMLSSIVSLGLMFYLFSAAGRSPLLSSEPEQLIIALVVSSLFSLVGVVFASLLAAFFGALGGVILGVIRRA